MGIDAMFAPGLGRLAFTLYGDDGLTLRRYIAPAADGVSRHLAFFRPLKWRESRFPCIRWLRLSQAYDDMHVAGTQLSRADMPSTGDEGRSRWVDMRSTL
jgi:hypothetical protein